MHSGSRQEARNLRADLQYDGTDFRGFAPQPAARTVGGEIERVLAQVLGGPTRVTPAGRTDSGVHAHGQVISFRTTSTIPPRELCGALNALMGEDVVVTHLREVEPGFDARKSALSRRYAYRVWNAPQRTVWEHRWTAQVVDPLDLGAMHEACQPLLGKHDFSAFRTHRSQDPDHRGTIRTVLAARWQSESTQPSILRFEIEADAFLRHMVRTIVGSAILIGLHKLPTSALGQMLESRDRASAGPTAPPCGLSLLSVTYDTPET
jgi:tRNA pseudouridine38-40 synthase